MTQRLKCPFSLEEMKAHYDGAPLTYETYHEMEYDLQRLLDFYKATGYPVECFVIGDEERIENYIKLVYKSLKTGGLK